MSESAEMEMRELGRTGLKISRLGFGAWAIGSKGYGPVERTDAEAALQAYITGGGNFLDTARGYADSEEIIGDYLQARPGLRDKLVIAGKLGMHDPVELRENLEISLRNLRIDTIDLLYLHSPPDDAATMNRVLDVYEEFRQEGKIRAIGASVKGPNVTQATVDLCRQYIATGRVDALQVIYSVFRQKNREMFGEANDAGVAIIARTALESGFLTGKYAPGHAFQEGDHRTRWGTEKLRQILEEVQRLRQEQVHPPFSGLTEYVLRYVMDQPSVTSLLVGGKTAAQVEEQLAILHTPRLPAEEIRELRLRYAGYERLLNPGG